VTSDTRPIKEDDLHAFVDGWLTPERRAQVERYLNENPAEAARVRDWSTVTASLRSALDAKAREPVPPQLDVRRLAAARAATRRWSTRAVGAAIAASIVLGIGTGWLARGSDRPTGVASIAKEALAAHQLLTPGAVRTVEWADPGMAGRITPPDLSAAGYTFKGRQVVATDEGLGSMLMYEDGAGNWISVFMRPMHQRDMTAPMQPVGNAPGFAWATDGLGVSLIASTPFPQLHGLADEVRRSLRS
jgi:anti-sigma factor RsiW